MPLPLTVVIDACHAPPERLVAALESVRAQDEAPEQTTVVGPLSAELQEALADFEGDVTLLDTGDASPGAARNRALAESRSRLALVVDGHEWLAAGALGRHASSLEEGGEVVASYGRTAVHTGERIRVKPDEGRGGEILGRLIKEKHLVSAAACLMWRRDALPAEPFGDYQTPWALRFDLTLALGRAGQLNFHPAVVAERTSEHLDLLAQEELVKVLVGILYGPEPLDERVETRARFRLARHLVALGKLHYRKEDYARAGKFFDEAVKAAPGYFKGRRYQFLNFLQKRM